MKPTLTPTQYQSLSEEDKGLYEARYRENGLLNGMEIYYRLKEPTKAEAETAEQADPFEQTKALTFAAMDKVARTFPNNEEKQQIYCAGAIFGANWQASNPDTISRARVIEILEKLLIKDEPNGKYYKGLDDGVWLAINTIKML